MLAAVCTILLSGRMCVRIFRVREGYWEPEPPHNSKGAYTKTTEQRSKCFNSPTLREIIVFVYTTQVNSHFVFCKWENFARNSRGKPCCFDRGWIQYCNVTCWLFTCVIYSCFVKGCPKKSEKRTRQSRKVVWVLINIFHESECLLLRWYQLKWKSRKQLTN